MYYRLAFKNNPDVVVAAESIEEAPAVAKMVHEFDGKTTSEIISIVKVEKLGQLFDFPKTDKTFPLETGKKYRLKNGVEALCGVAWQGRVKLLNPVNGNSLCSVDEFTGECETPLWSVKEVING